MAAKQILSLVVASIWVANLLCDNLKRAEDKIFSSFLFIEWYLYYGIYIIEFCPHDVLCTQWIYR